MSLIALKCPQCNGDLSFEDTVEYGTCQFCGAKVMVAKEGNNIVNNYNTTIVNGSNSEQISRMLVAARKAIDEENYDSARHLAHDALALDSTVADAYLIILLSTALEDHRNHGQLTKKAKEAVYSNYKSYHLYSDDSRTLRQVMATVGIDLEGNNEGWKTKEETTHDADECLPPLPSNVFFVKIIMLIIGMIMSIVGMLSFTGIYNWNLPQAIMYSGWALIIVVILFGTFVERRVWSDEEIVNNESDGEQ